MSNSSIRFKDRNIASKRFEEDGVPKEMPRALLVDVNGNPLDLSGEFSDSDFKVTGSSDDTKAVSFDVDSTVSSGEERVVKIPDASGTMALVENWTTTEQVHPSLTEDGETAYYKIVSLGAGPNASAYKDVAHGISNLDAIIKGWSIWDKGDSGSNTTDTFELAPDDHIKMYVGDTYVRVVAGADKRDRTGKAYLVYTKSA